MKSIPVHKFVKPHIKVSPHVRVKMDSTNAFRMVRGYNTISFHERPRYTIKKDILHHKELTEAISYASKSPKIKIFKEDNIILQC